MIKKRSFGLQWHITDKCDQRCEHCYIYAGKEKCIKPDISVDTLEAILNKYIEFCKTVNRIPTLSVTGGDPLLYSDAEKFFLLLKKNSIRFSILGNPFHLDMETASFLKDCGCSNYQMSIDGLETTHDFIRKPGSYKATFEKIPLLNEVGITSTIMTTVSKLNIKEIPAIIDEVVRCGAKNYAFARYCPNPEDKDNLISAEDYKALLEKVWKKYVFYKDSGTRFALKDHLWTLFLYEKGILDISNIEGAEDVILDGCHCGISHMTLLPDGKIYACRRCDSEVGNILEQSFYDIFFGKEMNKYRCYESFETCSKCELLRFCRGCPAVAKCVSEDFYSKDPQCWKKT